MDDFLNMVINCSNDNLENIIKERIILLESSNTTDRKKIIPNERVNDYGSYYNGFIKKDVKIYFSIGSHLNSCYSMANYDYAFLFFKKVKELGLKNKLEVIRFLPTFMDDYFGKFSGEDKREKFLLQYKGNATIDCFKGENLAACSERSAITNNLMEMIGIKSIYVTGTVNNEQHAFNIIVNNNSNNYYILDTTYNCTLYDMENKDIGIVPFFQKLGCMNEQIEKFLTDENSLEFNERIARKNDDGSIQNENNGQIRKYTIEPIILENKKTYSR